MKYHLNVTTWVNNCDSPIKWNHYPLLILWKLCIIFQFTSLVFKFINSCSHNHVFLEIIMYMPYKVAGGIV